MEPSQYEDKERAFKYQLAEELAYERYPEQTVIDDPELIDAMLPTVEKLMPCITQKQLEAQKLQVGGFKSDLLKMKQGYFDIDYLIDACDFELAELTKQEKQ